MPGGGHTDVLTGMIKDVRERRDWVQHGNSELTGVIR